MNRSRYERAFWLPLVAAISLIGVLTAFVFVADRDTCVKLIDFTKPTTLIGSSALVAILGLFSASIIKQILSTRKFLKIFRSSATISNNPSVIQIRSSLGLSNRDVWEFNEKNAVAFCAGAFSPKIFVSKGAIEKLSEPELQAVLAHEARHMAMRDPLRSIILRAVRHSFFFLPFIRILVERFEAIKEISADESSLAICKNRESLAQALYKLSASNVNISSFAFFADERVLSLRVAALSGRPIIFKKFGLKVLTVSFVALAGLLFAVTPRTEAKTTVGCAGLHPYSNSQSNLTNGKDLWNPDRIFVHPVKW